MPAASSFRVSLPLAPLVQALRLAALATPTRAVRDILNYALVTVDAASYTVRAGDGTADVEFSSPHPGFQGDEPWKFLLPPSTAHAALVDLPDEAVEVWQDDALVYVRGADDEFKFKRGDAKAYPGRPKAAYGDARTADVQDFLQAVKAVKASTGLGEPQRYVTTGALLVLDGEQGVLVGTDCASMAVSRFAAAGPAQPADAAPVLVPKRALDLMVKVLGDAEGTLSVRTAPNATELVAPGVTFTTGLLAGRFPEWKRFEAGCLADTDATEFDRAMLVKALKRVAAPNDLDYSPVGFTFTGERLLLLGRHEQVGEFKSDLPASGIPACAARIDVSYLIPALGLVRGDKVRFLRNRKNGYISVVSGNFSFFMSPLIAKDQ